jgi:RluA family pseudouridine synthase
MKILYVDEHLFLVDKPAGISVLPEGWDQEADHLVNILEKQFPKVWVVHRLDKITSGVMVFALTAEAHRSLNILFEKHEVEKKYHALVNGIPGWEKKTTKHPLRINVGHRHRTVVEPVRGKNAETRFTVIERHPSSALLEAQPMTGRTHQIRVHAMAVGHPLLGDTLYGAPETVLIARPALHSYSLSFRHPGSKEQMTYTAPYPADFENALKKIQG